MDPITTAILAAIGAGTAAGLTDATKKGIVDAYETLKSVIKRKSGVDSDLARAIEALEQKPQSKGRKTVLEEAVNDVKANEDIEITKSAHELLKQLENDREAKIALGHHIIQGNENNLKHVEKVKDLPSDPQNPQVNTVLKRILETNLNIQKGYREALQEMQALQARLAAKPQLNQQKNLNGLAEAIGHHIIQGNRNKLSHTELNATSFPIRP